MPGFGGRVAPHRGLSLVELLLALALGVVLSFGAMNLLLHSKRSFVEAEELARLQENGRHALRYLSHELTMAGYLATLLPATPLESLEAGSPCFEHLMAAAAAIEHVDDVNVAGETSGGGEDLPDDCLLAGRHLPGTDLLLTRRTVSAPVLAAGVASGAVDPQAIYLHAVAGPGSARLQRGGQGVLAGDELWEYVPQVIFLRNYSIASGDGVPTLCRKRQGRSTNRMAPAQCLVEGIENLQLEFGIDDDGDGQPDRFEAGPDRLELAAAVAARIYLLVRSVHRVPGYRNDRSYTLGQTLVEPAFDAHYRRLFQTTVLLRNRGVGQS
ncbi:MAG: PilW family protein [Halieaceae bacterium]|jgi:hypothetical protein|nr:PilW family protein [Halieaceae bacterium]